MLLSLGQRSRSNTPPGEDKVVHLFVGIYDERSVDYKNKKRKKTTVYPHGTAIAISPQHILTAYHNIDENRTAKSFGITSEIVMGEALADDTVIILSELVSNKMEDWSILMRTDGKQFAHFASVCPEQDLPQEKDTIGIRDYPVGLFASDSTTKLVCESIASKIICYEKIPIPNASLSVKSIALVTRDELPKKKVSTYNPDKVIRVRGGRVKGSCGAPYFDNIGRLIAFHFQSIDDFDMHSASDRSHVSYSCGYVLCRLQGFMQEYLTLQTNSSRTRTNRYAIRSNKHSP